MQTKLIDENEFEYEGKTYVSSLSDGHCDGCAFFPIACSKEMEAGRIPTCVSRDRKARDEVIFIEKPMQTKAQQDTDAILAMKAELDEERAMLDWILASSENGYWLKLWRSTYQWYVMTRIGEQITAFHDTPRAAIREAMEKTK